MKLVGIDPGKSGALSVIDSDSGRTESVLYSPSNYTSILSSLPPPTTRAIVENVHAMPKQGVSSSFNFGQNFGWILGVLDAFCIPYELVNPQKWKKAFSCTSDKNTSIEVCRRLFPMHSLLATPRCTKPHDGIAESLLMAEYGRRLFCQ